MAGDELRDIVLEHLEAIGPVVARRMFGGLGLFFDGLMFGLIIDDRLHFKVDAGSLGDYQAEGAQPFQYDRKGGKRTTLSYWQVPDRLLDDTDDLVVWARRAIEVSRRAARLKQQSATMRQRR